METGSKVIIRSDISDLNRVDYDIVGDMLKYAGKEAIILGFYDCDNFYLDIDDNHWTWNKELLELA